MEKSHIVQAVAQNVPPWIAVALGHLSSNITLQNAAFVASIAYSVVGVCVHLRNKR